MAAYVTPNSHYYAAIKTLQSRGGCSSLNQFCLEHRITTALTSVMRREGWIVDGWRIKDYKGHHRYAYNGPSELTPSKMDAIIQKTRDYARLAKAQRANTRKESSSELTNSFERGFNEPSKSVTTSYLWGLIKITRTTKQ